MFASLQANKVCGVIETEKRDRGGEPGGRCCKWTPPCWNLGGPSGPRGRPFAANEKKGWNCVMNYLSFLSGMDEISILDRISL